MISDGLKKILQFQINCYCFPSCFRCSLTPYLASVFASYILRCLISIFPRTFYFRLKYNFFPHWWMGAKSLHSCMTLCDPMDCSLPGSSVHRILQERILEWVAMPSSRGTSTPREWTCISSVSCIGKHVLYHSHHLGIP